MTVVVSHPTGNANVRAVLRAFEHADMLEQFRTTLAASEHSLGTRFLPASMMSTLEKRRFPEISEDKIVRRRRKEIFRQASLALGIGSAVQHETGFASVDAVYRDLDQALARDLGAGRLDRSSAVYAYEDGACETFRVAGERGIRRVYDLPIAHWRTLARLLSEEAELEPSWAGTMHGLRDSGAKRQRKDEEICLSDRIVVPSEFVRTSVTDHFGDQCPVSVVPFGCPPPTNQTPAIRRKGEPIQILFVGHLSKRKGLSYLIQALEKLDLDWRITLIGRRLDGSPPDLDRFIDDPRCDWLGVVPHNVVLQKMSETHVFLFPTIVEGFALVVPEALSAGLPVITTPNSGADILTHGKDAFFTPIRAPDQIATQIADLYDDEPMRQNMSQNALETARQSGWATYERAIVDLTREVISR